MSTNSTSNTNDNSIDNSVAAKSNLFDDKTGDCLDERLNRALGSVFGACIGDAAGAPLECLGREANQLELKKALELFGGGTHHTAPGQVTDDGELTVSLARGLYRCCVENEHAEFDLDMIADAYGEWARSAPFDMGLTCGSSIGVARSEQSEFIADCQQYGMARAMNNGAKFEAKLAAPSQSNGQLMRSSPLGIYGWQMTSSEIAELCNLDASLSHIADECRDTSTAYSIAIARLVNDVQCDGARAFSAAREWVEANACDRVKQWMADVVQEKPLAAYPHGGFVKIAFEFSMFYLKTQTPFDVALKDVLRRGGDTDTNACIVGGLLGALWGFNALPTQLKLKVIHCKFKDKQRPDFLHPATLLDLIPTIVERAPPKLTVQKRFPEAPSITKLDL
mmetsp:Transcript_8756/g.15048  ORF Transcript_8756/g.15048 Transcript_8756/m.15048 type:complete len:394 (-) Transcript_8756:759-1940(-)